MDIFAESQRFTQWWLWVILMGVLALSGRSIYFALSKKNKPGMPVGITIATIAIPILIVLFFLLLNLKTTIDETGISYQFFPANFNPKKNSWAEIDKAYIRKYSPMGEYGGWGIRSGGSSGKAYNVSGNMGLQIVFKDGRKLLIGTQKPDEINKTLSLLIRNGKISNTLNP